MVTRLIMAVLALLPACAMDQGPVRYVCDEPLSLVRAAAGEAGAGAPRDRGSLFSDCEAKGYHRRYEFSFVKSALLAKQGVEAQVLGSWCRDREPREAGAVLRVTQAALRFSFTYQWPTQTGKYPEVEFVLDRTTLRGGFADSMTWNCRLVQ